MIYLFLLKFDYKGSFKALKIYILDKFKKLNFCLKYKFLLKFFLKHSFNILEGSLYRFSLIFFFFLRKLRFNFFVILNRNIFDKKIFRSFLLLNYKFKYNNKKFINRYFYSSKFKYFYYYYFFFWNFYLLDKVSFVYWVNFFFFWLRTFYFFSATFFVWFLFSKLELFMNLEYCRNFFFNYSNNFIHNNKFFWNIYNKLVFFFLSVKNLSLSGYFSFYDNCKIVKYNYINFFQDFFFQWHLGFNMVSRSFNIVLDNFYKKTIHESMLDFVPLKRPLIKLKKRRMDFEKVGNYSLDYKYELNFMNNKVFLKNVKSLGSQFNFLYLKKRYEIKYMFKYKIINFFYILNETFNYGKYFIENFLTFSDFNRYNFYLWLFINKKSYLSYFLNKFKFDELKFFLNDQNLTIFDQLFKGERNNLFRRKLFYVRDLWFFCGFLNNLKISDRYRFRYDYLLKSKDFNKFEAFLNLLKVFKVENPFSDIKKLIIYF